jgi:phosphoadenosine phosphosulfate reductase
VGLFCLIVFQKGKPGFFMETPQSCSAELDQIAQELEELSPQEILAWAIDTYRPRITLACSFGGPSGMVLLDMVMQVAPDTPVFYLDTDFLFLETHQLIAEAKRKYGINLQAVRPQLTVVQQAAEYGEALWERDPDRCCELRKVIPQREALRDFDAWITGLRRDQASTRKATPVVAWDNKFGLAKIAPLARWDERAVWRYIYEHDVPYNQLHDWGYPSIGCTNCTRPVAPGEDLRAGRWSGFTKTECGLHTDS